MSSDRSNSDRSRVGPGCRGFTLVEILVVMVLFALAGAMVFSSVGKNHAERENRDFVRGFVSLGQKARRQAVASGRPVRLLIAESERSCRIEGEGASLPIPEAMLIEAEGGGEMMAEAFALSFYPDGSCDGVTFTFTAEAFERRIRIDMLTGIAGEVADGN